MAESVTKEPDCVMSKLLRNQMKEMVDTRRKEI